MPGVRNMSATDAAAWDRFVLEHPEGTFFHLSAWRDLIRSELGHKVHYLVCEGDDGLEGILPLAQVKTLFFGHSLSSLPFLVYGGVLAKSDDGERQLIDAAKDLAEELGADYLELRNLKPLPGDWPTKSTSVTFRKELDPDPDANLKAVPRKQRAMIRKGIKAGLEAEFDEDTSRLYGAMLECKRNLGTPFFNNRWLAGIKRAFGDKAEILTVVQDGATVASVMSFRFRDEILPYYGGGGALARDTKGNDFMYWEVMRRACLDGIRIFDYGRSTVDSGAYRFKKHWGFEPQPLYYQYHLVKQDELPNFSPANPKYEFLIRRWKQLPLAAAGMLGPPIARRLG